MLRGVAGDEGTELGTDVLIETDVWLWAAMTHHSRQTQRSCQLYVACGKSWTVFRRPRLVLCHCIELALQLQWKWSREIITSYWQQSFKIQYTFKIQSNLL